MRSRLARPGPVRAWAERPTQWGSTELRVQQTPVWPYGHSAAVCAAVRRGSRAEECGRTPHRPTKTPTPTARASPVSSAHATALYGVGFADTGSMLDRSAANAR